MLREALREVLREALTMAMGEGVTRPRMELPPRAVEVTNAVRRR